MPVALSPTSSQARTIPMISNATSRLLTSPAALALSGWRMRTMPHGELECERRQEQGDQCELPRHVVPRHVAGEDGSRPCGGEEDADDSEHDGGIPDIVSGHQAEQRDRQRISERQDAGGRADLLDDDRAVRNGSPSWNGKSASRARRGTESSKRYFAWADSHSDSSRERSNAVLPTLPGNC